MAKKYFTLEYGGEAKDGEVYIWRLSEMLHEIKNGFSDSKFIIHVSEYSDSKSLNQLGYLFGVVYPCAVKGFKELGDRLSIHQARYIIEQESPALRETFEADGVWYERRIGLSETKHEQMGEHIEFCIQYIAENFDIQVPDPIKPFDGEPEKLNGQIKSYK